MYRSEVADLECTSSVAESSSYNSLEVSYFLGNFMSYLEDMSVSSSSSLEELSGTPSSIIEKLSNSMLQECDEKLSKATEATPEVSEKKIWTTVKTVYYYNLKTKMINYFTLEKQAKALMAQAKETLCHILVSIQKELSKSDQMVTAGELSQIENVVKMMLEDIKKVSSDCGEELVLREPQQPFSSLSTLSVKLTSLAKSTSSTKSRKSEWKFALPGTPIPSELPESTPLPIVRCSVIDMSKSTKQEKLVCDARKSMSAIADTMKEVYPEEDGQWRPEKVHQIRSLLKRKEDKKVGKATAYELVQLFAEESPSFSSMTLAQGVSVSARKSEDRMSCTSSTSIFSDTVSVFTKVMLSLSRVSETSAVARHIRANMDEEKEDTTSHSGLAQNIVGDQITTSPDVVKDASSPTSSSDNSDSDDDFTGLISMLVVRLLSKIQTQTDLYPFEVARTLQYLIPKVMAVFCAMSGSSETQAYPENLKIHKMYRAMYKRVGGVWLGENPSIGRDSFDRIIVKSLSKELLYRYNEASMAARRTSFEATRPEALPLAEDVNTDLRLFLWLRIAQHSVTSALQEDLPSTSHQEKPCKNPLLIRMFSVISKGLSRPFK
ncbi:unnamed protein product [Coregonus sp. 'balchen']|nr:unnamed protein product [Coregonus sp. 'balchen']